jgi:hypothetical protein
MKKILVLSLIVAISCISCQQKESGGNIATGLLTQLNQGHSLDKIERVIVIPGEGCPGCISDAADFAERNIDKMPGTMVVFTRVLDKKLMRSKFKREFLAHDRVVIDSSNLLDRSDLLESYPVVLSLQKGEYRKSESFDKGMFAPLK